MNTGLKSDFISFTEHVMDALCPHVTKTPEILDNLFEDYKKGKYIRKPGLIWLNYTVANFFEQNPDDLRDKNREEGVVQARSVAIYFMYFHGHKREPIAQFYNCAGTTVSCAFKRVKDILNDKNKFHERKILQILKYQIL